MDRVEPKKIMSPWSGQLSKPKLREFDHGDKIVVEAWWYCPTTGEFITKGIVEERAKKSPDKKHD